MSDHSTVIEERVYVGNVDFTATEEELRDFFGDLNVTSVEIPSKTVTRGKKTFVKRLGFGFVQFDSKEEADKAIDQYNGKEFKTRHIYAKKALPPATEEEKQKKAEAYFAKQDELRAAKAAKAAKAPRAKKQANGDAGVAAAKSGKDSQSAFAEPSGEGNGAEAKPKPEEKVQDATKTPDGNKSKHTVFITNLDYKANVKMLSHMFQEYGPKWIHVPSRKVPFHVLKRRQAQHRPILNKGIAFVKFADEETQLKVIEEFNGKEINGRHIIVEVAVDRVIPDTDANGTSVDASEDAVVTESPAPSASVDGDSETAADSK